MPRPLLSGRLLTAQSALNTTANLDQAVGSKAEGTLVVVTFGAGTGAGVVVIEGAAAPTFTGTWAVLATLTWAAADRAHETFIAGGYLARRVRISTGVTGGTCNVDYLITG